MLRKLFLTLIASFFLCAAAFAAVNLNTASQSELESLKGVGPTKAQAIIDYRTKNGPFKNVDDLKNVKGFGDKTVDKLRSDVTVSGATSAPAKAEPKAAPAKAETAPAPAKTETKPASAKGSKEDKAKK